jgi:hypothetical protein
MVEHRVALVLCGHNHAYERFERDGVAYCTDGGGGALTYSVTKQIDEGKISDEELSWRQAAEESFGALKIDVAEDGTLNLSRYRASSREVVETFAVAPRS